MANPGPDTNTTENNLKHVVFNIQRWQ